MNQAQRLSIPAFVVACVALPFSWAFPDALAGWRFAGVVLGWVGCGLLLACLGLMLREPALSRLFGGLERMYGAHHAVGVTAYLILLAHPLALAADAWRESPAVAWSTLLPGSQAWPIWMGWAALLLLMAGLGASFLSRLPYRTWRGLHGLLGMGVLVAAGHLLLLGISGVILAISATLVGLLAWRLARADIGLGAAPFVVTSTRRIADETVEISLSPLSLPIRAAPGQFILTAFHEGGDYFGCHEYHPFTVSAIEPGGVLRIGVKALGDCSRRMQSVPPGTPVRVQGPFGVFMAEQRSDPLSPEIWIAGGIGITPFLARLRQGPPTSETLLLYFHRDERDAAFLDELRELSKTSLRLTLIEHATGPRPPDIAALLPGAADLAGRHAYLCGPPGLVSAAARVLSERGLPRSAIHFERFEFR